jgi:Rrf2 family protein
MLLTTRVSYGIRALIYLAFSFEKEKAVSINNISGKENISSIYLEQIFNQLKKHKIIKSIRGPKGGYTLARPPEELDLLKIVLALGGSIAPWKCVPKKPGKKACERIGICPAKEIWDEIETRIGATLVKYTLKDLSKRFIALNPEGREKVLL